MTDAPAIARAAPPLVRRDDWEVRLAAVLDRYARTAFGWGTADCLTLPADCVLAMTGVDPLAPWRGRYAGRDQAVALLARLAPEAAEDARLGAVVAATLAAHGAPRILPAFASHGDVVIATWSDAERGNAPAQHCGVVAGPGVALPGRRGLVFAAPDRIATAWRIG